MKKEKRQSENYLERIPMRKSGMEWTQDEAGTVTLNVPNTGFLKKMTQKLLKMPSVTYVHLDETGSFVWTLIDGEKNIFSLGESVKERFGEDAEPLYPRLSEFFRILESYGFVEWNI